MQNEKEEYEHHYKARISTENSLSPAKAKRLIQEIATLSNNLPLYLGSSVVLRVDENRIDVMQCLITGPTNTPYDSGCFLFDVSHNAFHSLKRCLHVVILHYRRFC